MRMRHLCALIVLGVVLLLQGCCHRRHCWRKQHDCGCEPVTCCCAHGETSYAPPLAAPVPLPPPSAPIPLPMPSAVR
jgi:hypothetical protein